MSGAPVVFVIDDDPSVRSSLKFLLSTVGLQAETFDSLIVSCTKSRLMFPAVLCWT